MSASPLAKRAAGTFVVDPMTESVPGVLQWATNECRNGSLRPAIQAFCAEQLEIVESGLVIVESISADCIQCRLPCKCYDGESASTFDMDVRFDVDPKTGKCSRKLD